jgi:hypothetical protein
VYVVACLSILHIVDLTICLFLALQCRRLQCMQLIHFLLLSCLDDVTVLMVVCFVDFSVRGISVFCYRSGDDAYVFLLVQC